MSTVVYATVTADVNVWVRRTVNLAGAPSITSTLSTEVGTNTSGGESLSKIVATTVGVAIVAPTGSERTSENVSVPSKRESSSTSTLRLASVTPAGMMTIA